MRFTGHERDLLATTSGANFTADDLDYLHARHSSPLVGRFFSVDSVNGKSNAPQSWNRYAYARANPLKYTDPDGKDVILVNRINDIAGRHAFVMVQLTGENRKLLGNRIDPGLGRVVLSSGPGFLKGKVGERLVKWYSDHLSENAQLFYIRPPKGVTMQEFERRVIAAWDSYPDGRDRYSAFDYMSGKSCYALARGILEAAGAEDGEIPSKWDLKDFNFGWNHPVKLGASSSPGSFQSLNLGAFESSWFAPYDWFYAGQATIEGISYVAPGGRL